jgi:hypothetical protein
MTEAEWLASREVGGMLAFADRHLSQRRRRLFAAACCRRVWHLLDDARCHAAVALAERCADEAVSEEELGEAAEEAEEADDAGRPAAWSASYACCPAPLTLARLLEVTGPASGACGSEEGREREAAAQASLLRDVVGNPFRPVALDPAWRTPDVQTFARAAYDNRTLPSGTLEPERLALLADALEEAGCDNPGVLGHLRGGGTHVRGCWAVDAILGKS